MSDNPTKYEVLIEQYLRSILEISGFVTHGNFMHLCMVNEANKAQNCEFLLFCSLNITKVCSNKLYGY